MEEMTDYEIWACKDPEKLRRLAYEQEKEHSRMAEELVRAKLFAAQKRSPFSINASIAYYAAVKAKIRHLPVYWEEFRYVMKLMKSENFNLPYLLVRVNRLFQQFPDLLKGFEMYVPPSYVHILYSESMRKRLEDQIGKLQPSGGRGEGKGEESGSDTHQGMKAEGQPEACETETRFACGGNAFPKLDDKLLNKVARQKRGGNPRDDSFASVSKHGTLRGLKFFDKVKKALGHQEVYDNFCKCLNLYVSNSLTRHELVQFVTAFLGKFPELLKELRDVLNIPESGDYIEEVPHRIVNLKPVEPDLAMEIDYCCGKKECASYRAIPSSSCPQDKASGRTPLCKEVLNDTWVSFPTWSEESTCLPSLKTEYEETMYRIEDEQFELDMAVQTNTYGIQLLENLQKKMAKMTDEDRGKFVLDDTLGGNSPVLAFRCLNRIYGDKTRDLIEGLKRNPFVAVPIVLNRLRVREKDWKEHQKYYNTTWKNQVKNIHPKALDVKGMNFRQVDSKNLRVKTLINEIETLFEEKKQKILEGSVGRFPSPHMIIRLRDENTFKNASDFISQHIRRQTGIQKDDKREIKDLFTNFILEIFGIDVDTTIDNDLSTKKNLRSSSSVSKESSDKDLEASEDDKNKECDAGGQTAYCRERARTSAKQPIKTNLPYFLFFGNNSWYIFFRLFFVLINRLAILHRHSEKLEKSMKAKGNSSSADTQSKYSIILAKIRLLLLNKIDAYTFEEEARNMFGTEAYVSYTFDKLIPQIIKQMHQLVNDDASQECIELCTNHIGDVNLYEILSPYVLRKLEESYKRRVMKMLEDENCYRIIWYTAEQVLTIELLDYDKEPQYDPVVAAKYSDYFDNFMDPDATDTDIEIRLPFLNRNLVKMKKFWWSRPKQISEFAEDDTDFKEKNVEIGKKPKASKSGVSRKSEKAEKLHDASLASELEETVRDGSEFGKPKKKFVRSRARRTQSMGGTNISKLRRNKKKTGLKRPRSSKTQQPAKKGRKEEYSTASRDETSNKLTSGKFQVGDDDDASIESQTVKISQLGLKEDDDDGTDSGKLTPVQKSDEEEEDSIEISADHLLFHLKETGMSICERYSESFGSQSYGSVEKPTEDQRNDEPCRSDISKSGIDSGKSIAVAMEEGETIPNPEKIGSQNKKQKEVLSIEDMSKILTSKIDAVCIAPDEQEVASLVEVTSSEQELSHGSKTAADDEKHTVGTSSIDNMENQREEAVGDESAVDSDDLYSDDLCFDRACEDMIIYEDTVAEIRRDSYKVVYAAGYGDFIYRRKSLVNARKSHEKFSRRASRKFAVFHKVWLDRYVTSNMLKSCHLWMIRSDLDRYQVNCVTINNSRKPPYGPYTKYFVRYIKRKKYCR